MQGSKVVSIYSELIGSFPPWGFMLTGDTALCIYTSMFLRNYKLFNIEVHFSISFSLSQIFSGDGTPAFIFIMVS